MLAVILSGGASRRMGSDKSMLDWGGCTLLQTLIDRYSAVMDGAAVSVDRIGRFPFHGALELPDPYPGMGPLNGIAAAFHQTDAQSVFLTATDLPFGDAALAVRLGELCTGFDACLICRDANAAAARGNKRGGMEPTFAVYRRTCLGAAEAALAGGDRSFRTFLSAIRVRFVDDSELSGFDLDLILRNMNTREEYLAWRPHPERD